MANRGSLACMTRHVAASRVATLLGEMSVASRAVYVLVGLSAAYLAVRRLAQPSDAPLAARAR